MEIQPILFIILVIVISPTITPGFFQKFSSESVASVRSVFSKVVIGSISEGVIR
jgi:hypothetical protein